MTGQCHLPMAAFMLFVFQQRGTESQFLLITITFWLIFLGFGTVKKLSWVVTSFWPWLPLSTPPPFLAASMGGPEPSHQHQKFQSQHQGYSHAKGDSSLFYFLRKIAKSSSDRGACCLALNVVGQCLFECVKTGCWTSQDYSVTEFLINYFQIA